MINTQGNDTEIISQIEEGKKWGPHLTLVISRI